VVRGDEVAEVGQGGGIGNVRQFGRGLGEVLEEAGFPNVGRAFIPGEDVAVYTGDLIPVWTAVHHIGVKGFVDLRIRGMSQHLGDLVASGPDVLEENRVSVLVVTQRFIVHVARDIASNRVGYNQRG